VVEGAGRLQAAVTLLQPTLSARNPVANLGRDLFRPESYSNGAALALMTKLAQLCEERRQLMVARAMAGDSQRQTLLEQLRFACVGFQPFKHLVRTREGILYYLRMARPDLVSRHPLSESLSQVSELAVSVLSNLQLPQPTSVRDGVTGYPLQSDLEFLESPFEEYRRCWTQAQSMNPPVEISGGSNLGWGMFRVLSDAPIRAILGKRGTNVVSGLAYIVDEQDRCVRIAEGFTTDDLSTGAMLQRAVKTAQEKSNAVYIEFDALMTSPKLLKSAEQLGFVPVSYFPGFCSRDLNTVDVVKLVKLNMAYSLENASLTTSARSIVDIIDRNFQDQKVGVAIINLLRGLPIFEGLGDGELRKISRLFTQKLYRPSERVFAKGDCGSEAYIVMRGQIDILREEQGKPLATIGNGQIFGELAFLDGAPRTAMAVAAQPSILLVIQREAFTEMVQREPHLGMVVMRNIAIELSNRLRRSSGAAPEPKK
jgi:hypothetical protein